LTFDLFCTVNYQVRIKKMANRNGQITDRMTDTPLVFDKCIDLNQDPPSLGSCEEYIKIELGPRLPLSSETKFLVCPESADYQRDARYDRL